MIQFSVYYTCAPLSIKAFKMKKKTILITGSSGKSGKAIAELLLPSYDIIGLDRISGDFTTHIGNLTDWATIKDITKGVSTIIHTASLHAPHITTHTRENFIDNNIKGTLFLLEAAQLNGIKKLIYTSTTSLYGESMVNPDKAVWITEEVSPIARDIYDITKLAAEALCKDFFDAARLQTMSLRVARFWDEPLDKKVFYRMFRGLDVRDVALAHKLAIDKDFDKFEVFNISAQSIFNISDLVALRKNLYPLLQQRCPKIIDLFSKQNWVLPDDIDRVYVIEKAKKLLGFEPIYNIDTLIEDLYLMDNG
jgi:UDP-glucose 4-epimerase